jgi:hypothetical protein
MVVKFLSGSEWSNSSDDEDTGNYDSDIQHQTQTAVGAERQNFLFSGKPGPNDDL